jgi:hypothetical protein
VASVSSTSSTSPMKVSLAVSIASQFDVLDACSETTTSTTTGTEVSPLDVLAMLMVSIKVVLQLKK